MGIRPPRTAPRAGRASLIAVGVIGMTMVAGCGTQHAATAGARTATATPSITRTPGVARASVVPWTGRAAHYTAPSPLPVTPPPTSAPPCTAADLSAQAMHPSALAGSVDDIVKLVNVGPATCLARGYPTSALLTGGNAPDQRLTLTDGGGLVMSLEASDIRPGAAAYLYLNAGLGCHGGAAGTAYPLLRLGLPGGGSVLVHAWSTGIDAWDFPCPPAQVSTLGVMPPQPAYPPDPLTGIRFSLVLPPTVRAGTTLRYVADLANSTGHVVQLSPCPSYVEFTNSFGTAVKLEYSLNCAAVRAIGAHQTIAFAMRMPVPATAPPGLATIRWVLIGPPAPTPAHGQVRVLSPTG